MKELIPMTKLIKYREEAGMTQEELAKLAKLSRPMLSHIERGAALPSLTVAFRISKVLNKSIEELFFNKNARKMSKSKPA